MGEGVRGEWWGVYGGGGGVRPGWSSEHSYYQSKARYNAQLDLTVKLIIVVGN